MQKQNHWLQVYFIIFFNSSIFHVNILSTKHFVNDLKIKFKNVSKQVFKKQLIEMNCNVKFNFLLWSFQLNGRQFKLKC